MIYDGRVYMGGRAFGCSQNLHDGILGSQCAIGIVGRYGEVIQNATWDTETPLKDIRF